MYCSDKQRLHQRNRPPWYEVQSKSTTVKVNGQRSTPTCLLVPPLHRTVAFVQPHHIVMVICKDLQLHVPWTLYEALEQHPSIPKGARRLALC